MLIRNGDWIASQSQEGNGVCMCVWSEKNLEQWMRRSGPRERRRKGRECMCAFRQAQGRRTMQERSEEIFWSYALNWRRSHILNAPSSLPDTIK